MMFYNETNMRQELKKCMDCYMVGRLAVDEMSFPGGQENEPITLMRNSDAVIFFIKSLSNEPFPIKKYSDYPNGNLYIGIDSYQPTSILNDPSYHYKPFSERIEYWRERLEGRLILFKPVIKFSKTGQPFFLNLEIVAIEGEIEGDSFEHYLCIPKINLNPALFEMKLLDGSYINLDEYNHFMPDPTYVICGDYLYFNFKHWVKSSDNSNMWKVDKQANEILKVKLDFNNHEFSNYVVSGTEHLEFINELGGMSLNAQLHDYAENISSVTNTAVSQVAATNQLSNPMLTKTAQTQLTPMAPVSTMAMTTSNSTMMTTAMSHNQEVEFLEELYNRALKEGLSYNRQDLINFHVSVKTNPLTIVAGMSGTGKTQLAHLYAHVLGLSEENRSLLFLPISPSYLEPADVLGYLNANTGHYVPAETGLVDILINAEKNPDHLYMVIFDEMNLSQVEYWFAPFLSLLELKKEERRLKLYSKESVCHNRGKYPDTVMIGDNILFIGTVNLDETTKEFSDRLLDRVNVVSLQKERFVSLKQEKLHKEVNKIFNYNQFKSWINKKDSEMDAYTLEELAFFDELHDLISRYDAQKGVSYRLLKKIGSYINNLPKDKTMEAYLTKSDALDLGIKQRLLPKLKGSERQLGGLIGTTLSPSQDPTSSELLTLLQDSKVQQISSFQQTQKELRRKALELGIYGHTN